MNASLAFVSGCPQLIAPGRDRKGANCTSLRWIKAGPARAGIMIQTSREEPMTAMRGFVPATESGALGVHSLDQFVIAVPDLSPAQQFYRGFGLDVQESGGGLALKTFGNEHS